MIGAGPFFCAELRSSPCFRTVYTKSCTAAEGKEGAVHSSLAAGMETLNSVEECVSAIQLWVLMPALGQQKALVGLGHGSSGDGLGWLVSLTVPNSHRDSCLLTCALAYWTSCAIGLLQGWLRLLKSDFPPTISARKFLRLCRVLVFPTTPLGDSCEVTTALGLAYQAPELCCLHLGYLTVVASALYSLLCLLTLKSKPRSQARG